MLFNFVKLINIHVVTCLTCRESDLFYRLIIIFVKNLNERRQMKITCFNIRGIKKKKKEYNFTQNKLYRK